MSHMIVQYGEISNRHNKDNSNKDDTFNVTKAVAKRSISIQITKARAVNWIPLDTQTGLPHDCE
jgi:hypothetical protein